MSDPGSYSSRSSGHGDNNHVNARKYHSAKYMTNACFHVDHASWEAQQGQGGTGR